MAKLTLQEQLLKAGLVTSKKAAKVERTAKKSRVQAREARAQLINGRLAIARLLVDNNSEGEYAIIPASVADKIAQRDASSIVLHSALSAEEQDEDDPYADFKVPDDLMW